MLPRRSFILSLVICVGLCAAFSVKGRPPTPIPQSVTSSSTHVPQQQVTMRQESGLEQQEDPNTGLREFYDGMEKFALNLFGQVASDIPNVAFSPLTSWVLLAMMSEGASGTTLQQLRRALVLPQDVRLIHQGFGNIRGDIRRSTGSNNSQLEMGSAIFTMPYQSLKPDFEQLAESYYNTTLEKVNFRNTTVAAKTINSWVSDITRGHIESIVEPGDLKDAEVVLTSALYFRGAWKLAFNESNTRPEPFFDEEGHKLGDVDMMYQVGKFRMSFIEKVSSLALELPYASGRNSMLLILPRRGSTIAELFEHINNASQPLVADIMKQLVEDEVANDDDEDIHVYLPKFELDSQIKMAPILKKMGITALFQRGRGELKGLSHLDLYVSDFIHKATINVNEQGTVATAASSAILHNYSLPSTFKGNRPFIFMIVQKSTNTILFAGKVGNPSRPSTES